MAVIGEGLLAREYINAMYDMLTAYDFLLEDLFYTQHPWGLLP